MFNDQTSLVGFLVNGCTLHNNATAVDVCILFIKDNETSIANNDKLLINSLAHQ